MMRQPGLMALASALMPATSALAKKIKLAKSQRIARKRRRIHDK